MEDKEVIESVLKGNVNDFETLIERHQRKLQSALTFYCLNRQELEDLLHDSLVKAYLNLSKFDSSKNFYPWLKTLSLNLLRDKIRKNKKISERDQNLLLERIEHEKCESSEEKQDALSSCLSVLHKDQHDLIRSRYWKKISIESLAESFNRSPSAVKMQLLRIRDSLKKCVKMKLEESGG